MMKRASLCISLFMLAASAHAQVRDWNEYHTVLWMSGMVTKHMDQWPVIAGRMKELGINTGMGSRDAPPQQVIDSGFGYYVENIVNKGLCLKFSSSVTNWSKFVDEWAKTRSDKAFVRDYCFDDPKWLGSVTDIMSKTAAAHAPSKPLMYDLRDELSVTISANPFDYDFSPQALAGFREWLKMQYKDLEVLNGGWDTDYASWEAVMPFSTDQIKRRMITGERMPKGPPEDWSKLKHVQFDPTEAAKNPVRWNFAPWCDFRSYMEDSLARTLANLRDAAHAKDPATPVGIEGTQMPHAFGGYDLWKLSQAVDWMEPYDVGCSREILGSFMPDKPLLATVFEKDTNHAMRRLWHLLLLGDKGCIVWWSDDVIDWSKPDLPLSEKGKALAPALKAMTSPLAKLFLKAKREFDPIAIHYSQPSIQVAWLMESAADGSTWQRRFSSFESTHNKHAELRNAWLKLLQDLGYSPRFLSDQEIAAGALGLDAKPKHQVVVFPRSWSAIESARAAWAEEKPVDDRRHRSVFTDGDVDFFDSHGRFIAGRVGPKKASDNGVARATEQSLYVSTLMPDGNDGDEVEMSLERYVSARVDRSYKPEGFKLLQAGLTWALGPGPINVPFEARVRTHRFTLGKARLLAFERNIDYKMSEDLAQAGGNENLEKPIVFTAKWNGEKEVIDLRSGMSLGRASSIEVHLDPWQPSLYALVDNPIEGDPVEALLK